MSLKIIIYETIIIFFFAFAFQVNINTCANEPRCNNISTEILTSKQQEQHESKSRNDEKIFESTSAEKSNRYCHEETEDENESATRIRLHCISSELPKIREEDSDEIKNLVSDDGDSETTDLNDKMISRSSNKNTSNLVNDKKATNSLNENLVSNGANDKSFTNNCNDRTVPNGSNEKNVSDRFLDQKSDSVVLVSTPTKPLNSFRHFVSPSNFTDEEKETLFLAETPQSINEIENNETKIM